LGFEAGRMRAELDGLGAIPVMNDGWRTGMGSSLRCGVASVLALDPGPRNLLLLVCDQIALDVEILRELLRVHGLGERPVTASRYGGRSGVPAVFSSAFFPELLNVSGDRGARRILDTNAGDVACVDFHEGELDLDTPEQLRASRRGEA
jgi:molybdenum cofactor cytidylyltransferase